jgi:hypothetical protein
VLERLSYDAWDKRRYADGSDDPAGVITSQTNRGFTEHEQLDSVALVHMNGRVYDPLLARFGTPASIYALDELVCLPHGDPDRARFMARAERRYYWAVWTPGHTGRPSLWWLATAPFKAPSVPPQRRS